MSENLETLQILNTAIVRSKEKKIDNSYEEKLRNLCSGSAISALNKSIIYLSEHEKISRDEAALKLIETLRELDAIWSDYVTMEGIENLKALLKKN